MSKRAPQRKPFSIVLPVDLHKQAKKAAIDAQISASAFVEEALRVALSRRATR